MGDPRGILIISRGSVCLACAYSSGKSMQVQGILCDHLLLYNIKRGEYVEMPKPMRKGLRLAGGKEAKCATPSLELYQPCPSRNPPQQTTFPRYVK